MRRKYKVLKEKKLIETCDTNNDVICVTTNNSSWSNWNLDFICSFYVCANKKLLNRYKPYDAGDVVMANGSKSKVIGLGKMKVTMFDRVIKILDDKK